MSKIVLVLCVAVLASTLQRAATRRDFAQSHWRSLLESPNSGMAPANGARTYTVFIFAKRACVLVKLEVARRCLILHIRLFCSL